MPNIVAQEGLVVINRELDNSILVKKITKVHINIMKVLVLIKEVLRGTFRIDSKDYQVTIVKIDDMESTAVFYVQCKVESDERASDY